ADAYERLMGDLVDSWPRIEGAVLGPPAWPRHPLALGRFGLRALRSAQAVARATFPGERARGLFAGIAAHGMLPLDTPPTAAFALVLGLMAHVAGWPLPRGGAQRIPDALAGYLRSLGGEIVTGVQIRSIDELPPARAVL